MVDIFTEKMKLYQENDACRTFIFLGFCLCHVDTDLLTVSHVSPGFWTFVFSTNETVFTSTVARGRVSHLPADGLDDAVQLIIGGRVTAAHREHEVDGIKQAREGLGEVRRLIRLQRVLQSLLGAAHTHKEMLFKNTQWMC